MMTNKFLIYFMVSILLLGCNNINIDTKLTLARKAYSEKDYKETLSLLEDVSIEGLDKKIRFDIAYLIGKAKINLGLYKASIIEFNYCIELDKTRDDLYNDRGYAYQQIGQNEQSIKDFNIAIISKPNEAIYLNNRGFSYMEMGQIQNALRDFNLVIKSSPAYPYVYNNMGIAMNKLGKSDSAYISLNKAIELKPDYKEAYVNRAVQYIESHQLDKAEDDLNQSLRIDSTFYKANYILALIDLSMGDTVLACEKLKKAIKKGDSEIDAFYTQLYKQLNKN